MMKSKELHFGPNSKMIKEVWKTIEKRTTRALYLSIDRTFKDALEICFEAKIAIKDEIWSGKKMGRWTERYDWRF